MFGQGAAFASTKLEKMYRIEYMKVTPVSSTGPGGLEIALGFTFLFIFIFVFFFALKRTLRWMRTFG